MYDVQVRILRYGVIIGLIIVIVGLLINPINILKIIGLAIIVLTPLTSLSFISIKLFKERRRQEFILSQFTIIVIIISIIISLLRNY